MSANPSTVSAPPPRKAAAPAPPRPSAVNRIIAAVLRSPLSGAVDSALALLTVRGRRTGRELTLPVQYAAGDDALWVWPGHPQAKTWWRNLRTPAPVRLRLRGQDVTGQARVVTGLAEPAVFDRGWHAYATRFPHAAAVGFRGGPPEAVLVRVSVPPDVLARTRRATAVPGCGLARVVRRHPLGAYFLLTFLFSWASWIPLAIIDPRVSHFPGLLGPLLAAVAVTGITAGRPGLADLARRMARWRVSPRWYATALVPPAVAALVLGVLAALGRPFPSLSALGAMPGLPEIGWLGVFALVVLVNGYGEETGWRGLAWPRLRERHGVAGAALILTVPWAVWHIPSFWLATGLRGFPPALTPAWVLGLAAGAVVLGWLYERARASLLVVALFHALLNMASATRGTAGVAAAVTIVVMVWAALILRAERRHATAHQS